MPEWTHLSIAALWFAVVAFGVRDESRQNTSKQSLCSDGHAVVLRDPEGASNGSVDSHEQHILHVDSHDNSSMTDEQWYSNMLTNRDKTLKALERVGGKIDRVPGYWVIGTKLFSRDSGVVLKIADEMFSPGTQWMMREMYQFPGNVGLLARYPWKAAWPWMDKSGNFIHRSFEQSELQKIGPFPELDALGFWSTYGAPQLNQSSPCNCKWTSTCKFYYEVELLNDPEEPQIGWATTEISPSLDRSQLYFHGVGDDKNGWAADGKRNAFFFAGNAETGKLSAMWRKGDVVGLAVDIPGGTMKWSLNGYWKHGPEKHFELDQRQIFPCLSMWGDFNMLIASTTWKFAPPETDYVPWTDAPTFAGHEPLPSDIEIVYENDDSHVSVTGEDANFLGINGDYHFKWDGIGQGEPYYVLGSEDNNENDDIGEAEEGEGEPEHLYIYHVGNSKAAMVNSIVPTKNDTI